MPNDLLARIEKLDDFHAVRQLEHFSNRLLEAIESDLDEVVGAVPEELRDQPTFKRLLTLSDEERDKKLPAAESVAIARALLRCFAEEPELAPFLEESMDTYKDDELFVAEILALGVAASMTILASTTSFKIVKTTDKDGNSASQITVQRSGNSKNTNAVVKQVLGFFGKVASAVG